ncbi:MAG: hypothetical protein C4581_13520 [Nitrospiraceae bacterium]|nr:MAG: hypothetical protein C4581_13520 [Nitrospiraceae bacterium]
MTSAKRLLRNASAALSEVTYAALIKGNITARYVSRKRKRLKRTVVTTVPVQTVNPIQQDPSVPILSGFLQFFR